VTGIGTISGVSYVSSSLATDDSNLGPAAETADFVDKFTLIAQGESLSTSLVGDDLYMYEHFKVTVDANGVPTVFFDTPKFDCH
jgi:hypothetical protein